MTIAYLFWHAAPEGASAAYEEKLRHFAASLAKTRTPGLLGNASYRIAGAPWMPEPGYEDWAWLEGSWALDELNRRAVDGAAKAPHDAVAGMTKHGGFGALYYLVAGELVMPGDSSVFWAARPRGVDWRDFIPRVMDSASSPVSVWRRQMVLGPSAEFAFVGAPGFSLTLPAGWSGTEVRRRRVWSSAVEPAS
jgi:hypothetical protein